MRTILTYGFLLLTIALAASAEEPLRVCAATSDLGSIAAEVGGDLIVVQVFAKGSDDPHFVEARPSFVKALSRADAMLITGLELEIGWIPPLLQQCTNARV